MIILSYADKNLVTLISKVNQVHAFIEIRKMNDCPLIEMLQALTAHDIFSLVKHSSGPLYYILYPTIKAVFSDPIKLSKSFNQVIPAYNTFVQLPFPAL